MTHMKKQTILFVDDKEYILETLKNTFEEEPYQLLTAKGGEEGFRLLGEHSVQMVFSDYTMPGMDGVEFLRQVKERYPATIRCLFSGVIQEEDVIPEQIGIHYFLKKPFDSDQIKAVIHKGLGI